MCGLCSFNKLVHSLTGVHMAFYTLTDWLGLIPLGFMLGFALLGLVQLVKRRSLFRVDADILVLGGFYIVVIAAYFLFETVVVNYRPVLIDGYLEASYPSSTTLLVLCVMPTAVLQLNERMQNPKARKAVAYSMTAFTVFMVIGRLISGVHWVTDIIGGFLLSVGLGMIYDSVTKLIRRTEGSRSTGEDDSNQKIFETFSASIGSNTRFLPEVKKTVRFCLPKPYGMWYA